MKVKYSLGNLKAEKDVRAGEFFLTNRLGGFYASQTGWFIFEKEMFKILELFDNRAEILEQNFYQVNRKGKWLEEYFFPLGTNSLIYGASGEIELVLDVKKVTDKRAKGRQYELIFEKDKTIIHFTKRTDKREDKTEGVPEFEMFMVVDALGQKIGQWEENKEGRSVFRAVKFKPGRYVISAGRHKEKVLSENQLVSETWGELLEKQKKYFETFLEQSLGHLCATTALDSLIGSLDNKNLLTGLPDKAFEDNRAAIACKALILEGELELAKKILFGLLDRITSDGWLPGREKNSFIADGTGWLFLRLSVLVKHLNEEELKLVKAKLVEVLEKTQLFHLKNDLVYNKVGETWLNSREGFCIEMQALQLRLCKLAFRLLKDRKYKVMEERMKTEVKEKFFDGEILVDCLGDLTSRPNMFLAAYIYPDLLSKEEWSLCFEHVLERNWLDWGGLSIVDKKMAEEGKSWFWVNNLAAIAMLRINKEKFKDYIEKIYRASVKEMLLQGSLGGCAEFSSSKELTSEGCLNHAWSCATLIELMEELGI